MTDKPSKPSSGKTKKTGSADKKPAESISSGNVELTDDDLTKVSGGAKTDPVTITVHPT